MKFTVVAFGIRYPPISIFLRRLVRQHEVGRRGLDGLWRRHVLDGGKAWAAAVAAAVAVAREGVLCSLHDIDRDAISR
jgi:hypothetical protein